MIQQLEHYKSGGRINPRMVILASLARLSEDDMEDLAAYYYTIDLDKLRLTEIAIRVNQAMLDVMVAGATGEF